MKTKSFLAALIVLVGATAFAGGPGLRVAVVGQQKPGLFKVIYEGDRPEDVTLNIYNANGRVIFNQVTENTKSFVHPFSMKEMEPGEYTIEVTSESGKAVQKILYAQSKPLKNAHVAKLPSSGKYLLAIPAAGTKEINVSIFDGNKNLVHSEDRIIDGSFGLVYSLQNVSGIPTFEITEKNGLVLAIPDNH